MIDTTTMYLIVDESSGFKVIDGDDFTFTHSNPPLAFSTYEEAELHRKPGQTIVARDGCPIPTALLIEEYSRVITGTRQVKE